MALDPLFQPFALGDLTLKNRIVMAPLTRSRASAGTDAPNDLNVDYYRQRAGAGLIIAEATQISQQGQGYVATPGIYTSEQVEGWRKVTKAVHQEGGRIFLQLWHVGRISHTSLQPNGGAPVAPSAIKAKGQTYTKQGRVDFSMPRALEAEEIPGIIRGYLNAAENAERAGFDGVELHAANGYLLDQFLRDGANKRQDAYGGSVDNRTRLTIEALLTLCRVFPKERVGIRLSPVSHANDLEDSNPTALYDYLVRELDALKIAYMHVIEGETQGPRDPQGFDFGAMRKSFHGAYMANNGYDGALAAEAVSEGRADFVAFGRAFISNPDLPERLRQGAPLTPDDKDTWYGGGAEGYTTYPTLEQAKA
ncbi:alkene reductase [Lichenihabitans sp. Uapishka_5]|uniref:alkene reductase n=1 Tax=Lichenihabitans sp. Uapishka_5 TaxID=3037302 RepID=UPI0029E8014D|nr:alkene reductase [Lichenihabitans sp. Uapishka_5]MDX7949955.1 alkene reductase [Lichenihabitans sp. Uapishka_5]